MKCPTCGNISSDPFCSKCGTKLITDSQTSNDNKKESSLTYFSEDCDYINSECSSCKRVIKIPRTYTKETDYGYFIDSNPPIKCPCGMPYTIILGKARKNLSNNTTDLNSTKKTDENLSFKIIIPSIFIIIGALYIIFQLFTAFTAFSTWFKAIIYGIIAWLCIISIMKQMQSESINKTLDLLKTKNFNASDYIKNKDLLSDTQALIIDKKNHKICFLTDSFTSSSVYNYHIYDSEKIIEIEVIQNGESISKTSRSSQIGGAIVGGVLLGGLGAVAGALSGKKTITEKINSIQLKVIVKDSTNPCYNITISNMQCSKNDYWYKEAIKTTDYWYGLIKGLIQNKTQ